MCSRCSEFFCWRGWWVASFDAIEKAEGKEAALAATRAKDEMPKPMVVMCIVAVAVAIIIVVVMTVMDDDRSSGGGDYYPIHRGR